MNIRLRRRNVALVGMIFTLLVAAAGAVWSQGKKPVCLTVSAAASLQAPLETIGQLYMKENPEVKLVLNFGASGALRQQIEEGAPVDLFFPAAVRDMDQLQTKRLIVEATRRDLLKNTLVLIVNKNGDWIQSFSDLSSKRLTQVALGNPASVPVGMYARESLTYLGLWKQVEAKAVYAKDVKQVLTWVATGNIDAGLVYSTDAKLSKEVKTVAVALEKSHSAILYPAAVVKASPSPREAVAFLEYLDSAKAKSVFVQFGFSLNSREN